MRASEDYASSLFEIMSPFEPAGDQPAAIASLIQGLEKGLRYQTLLGVTGSGKTFTMAQVIAQTQRPALILAPNKTLAAQLYSEMKAFFPKNAVEYFVSYYDYYQPEAYIPSRDLYIEKDASINEQIEQMRLSATKALVERPDVIIVATVSAIYGLGDPHSYMAMILPIKIGEYVGFKRFITRLIDLQYLRNDFVLKRGTFRVRGEVIDIVPAEQNNAFLRVVFDEDRIEQLQWRDLTTGALQKTVMRTTLYPENHYVTPYAVVSQAIEAIQIDLQKRLEELKSLNKLVEAQRLEYRVMQDIEFLRETGHCQGIENYSAYLSSGHQGGAPATLLSYLPENHLLFCDESHLMLPQIGAMYHGDRSRKMNLVEYGFRLPSCLFNRPLMFEEFEERVRQAIFVSATPGPWEIEHQQAVVEQIVRPTGLIDPQIIMKDATMQVQDAYDQILDQRTLGHRVMITTLTKKMSEDLSDYLNDLGIRAQYLHSELDSGERLEVISQLRSGAIDVLIGINLLREGLDLPEVALVMIFDADKEGFLRSTRSLIQTIGRAARNAEGKVIFYASHMTASMKAAIEETDRRRLKQQAYNEKFNITPKTIKKAHQEMIEGLSPKNKKTIDSKKLKSTTSHLANEVEETVLLGPAEIDQTIYDLTLKMHEAAALLDFEKAAEYRNQRDFWKQKKEKGNSFNGFE